MGKSGEIRSLAFHRWGSNCYKQQLWKVSCSPQGWENDSDVLEDNDDADNDDDDDDDDNDDVEERRDFSTAWIKKVTNF